ncbi:MAG: hypothetical protein QXU97_02565 [Fervidicoccaceae archaeon]
MTEKRARFPLEVEFEEIVKTLESFGARWAVIGTSCTEDTIEIEVIGRKGFVYLPCWLPKAFRKELEQLLSRYGGEHGEKLLP